MLSVILKKIVCINNGGAGIKRETDQPLRLVIMSATFNSDIFASYFAHRMVLSGVAAKAIADTLEGAPIVLAPILNVGSKCYPVKIYHYDEMQANVAGDIPPLKEADIPEEPGIDSDDIFGASQVVKFDKGLFKAASWIVNNLHKIEEGSLEGLEPPPNCHNGAVLIFLPGVGELTDLMQEFAQAGITDGGYFDCIEVHGLLDDTRQERMFRPARDGVRKVIVATNIAESSVTISDAMYVIDFGLEKLPFFDARNNTEALLLKRCSQASAKQRTGRAGRVAPGVCFRLYSKAAHDKAMPRFAPPEMLRTSLLTLVLKVKIMDKDETASTVRLATSLWTTSCGKECSVRSVTGWWLIPPLHWRCSCYWSASSRLRSILLSVRSNS